MSHQLREEDISNQCVLLCDLAKYQGPQSESWEIVKGTQDQVGAIIAKAVTEKAVTRIDDFGGVCKTFLCYGESYRERPPKTKPGAAVFSFTPKKRAIAEGHEMARAASLSGYELLILTLQKHDKYGKVWVLEGTLRHSGDGPYVYYEDTGSVVDELKESSESSKVTAVHVRSPGFEAFVSKHADRVVTQEGYQREVLERETR
jgi:hypothetical protein